MHHIGSPYSLGSGPNSEVTEDTAGTRIRHVGCYVWIKDILHSYGHLSPGKLIDFVWHDLSDNSNFFLCDGLHFFKKIPHSKKEKIMKYVTEALLHTEGEFAPKPA